jgi:hypothetical protein
MVTTPRYLRGLFLIVFFGGFSLASRAGEAIATADLPASQPGESSDKSNERTGSVDLRPAFERYHLGARRQGDRGTCSAFVMTGAIEFAASRQLGRGTRLSVEFLNWASNHATRTAADGGFFSDLWKGVQSHGVCPERDMPYLPSFDPSARPGETALAHARAVRELGLRLRWIKEWDPHKGLSDGQLEAVKRVLRDGWPVCGGFLWPKEERWEGGVLRMVPRVDVRDGHSVLLVGYREEGARPGDGVFLIRNSGGPGADGMLTFHYVKEYMNDAAWVESGGDRASTQSGFLSHDTLDALTAPPSGRSRRISSNEQPRWNDANLDMNWLQPGQVLELPVLEGPGVITHLWFTSHAGWANELNALSLRIYWDGRKEPGVEAPLGDFFTVGQGKPAAVESFPVQVSTTGSLTCFWRMPFARSAPSRREGEYLVVESPASDGWTHRWQGLDPRR